MAVVIRNVPGLGLFPKPFGLLLYGRLGNHQVRPRARALLLAEYPPPSFAVHASFSSRPRCYTTARAPLVLCTPVPSHLLAKMSVAEVSAQCGRLVRALMVIINPDADQLRKNEALQMCDAFLHQSPFCIPCGLKLAESTQPSVIQQYGLKILEHVVKFRWDVITVPEKVFLKKRALMLVSMGTKYILEEEPSIKEYVARIVVEIIEHDWPKFWPELLPELANLTLKGETQAELVMFILLMFANDVVNFQKLPYHQGRPLKASIHKNMQEILEIVRAALRQHGKTYCRLRSNPSRTLQVRACGRVLLAALDTLAGYINWMGVQYIVAQKCNILRILWYLMDDSQLKMKVSECMLAAIKRIDDLDGVAPLVILFTESISRCLSPPKTIKTRELTEERYAFMKKQCELVCAIGGQLCRTEDTTRIFRKPLLFEKYLDHLLDFTTHPSQSLSSITQSTWKDLFSHEPLSLNPQLLAIIPKYLRATRKNLMRVGFPSENDSPSCPYSRLEFGDDETFKTFFTAFRNEQKTVIELACRLDHRTSFKIASDCLKSQLSTPVDAGPKKSLTSDGLCNASTPSFLQWEAVTFFVKIIIDHIFKVQKKQDIPVNDGIELLQLVLKFKTQDTRILACVQTNIATLIPFLNFKNEKLPLVLSRMVGFIEEIKAPKAEVLKSARTYACVCILKMCKDNGQILLPGFEILYTRVKQLLCDEQVLLTVMEKNTLIEAMVLLINQFRNYQRQKALLEELMEPSTTLLMAEEMQRVLSDPEAFIRYVGADLQITGTIVERPTDLNRSNMINCVSSILGVLRRSHCPTDLNEAKAGGFVIGFLPNGKPLYRNPCTEQVMKLLNSLFVLIRVQHDLYLGDVGKKMSVAFAKALNMVNVKNTTPVLDLQESLLETYDDSGYKTELERMQAFFCSLYETCFCILGHVVSSMKQDFFTMNDLVGQFLKSAFVNLDRVPCHRLLVMLRVFLKPLAHACPPEYHETLLSPIVGAFLRSLSKTLSTQWYIIDNRNMSKKKFKSGAIIESLKIVKKQVKLLTGEVTEFLITCCVPNEDTDTSNVPTKSDVACSLSHKDADTSVVTESSENKKGDKAAEAGWESFKTMMMSMVKEQSNKQPKKIKENEKGDKAAEAKWESFKTMMMSTVKQQSNKQLKKIKAKPCVSNKDEDATVCTAESDDEDCVSNADADTSVHAERDDACSESNEDADTIVVPAVSDGACCVSIENASTIVAASVSDVACNLSNEDDENSVIAAESDDDCCVPIEDAATTVVDAPESDDAYSQSNKDADDRVAAESDDVCSQFSENDNADTSVAAAESAESDDGEMAVEIQPPPLASTGLTPLGVCLMKQKNVRSALLTTAFSSLQWNGSLVTYKKATHLCWLLLKQAILEPPSTDTVTTCYTMVLKGLQACTADKFSINAIFNLAFQIYESLRPDYKELKEVMKQVAHVNHYYLTMFDDSLVAPKNQKPGTNSMQHYFRRLLKYNIQEPFGEKSHNEPFINSPRPSKKRKLPPFAFKKTVHSPPFKMQKLKPLMS